MSTPVGAGAISLGDACESLTFEEVQQRCPQHPKQARTLHAAIVQLARQQQWRDLCAIDVAELGQYVLRGVSQRLHSQQLRADAAKQLPPAEQEMTDTQDGADETVQSPQATISPSSGVPSARVDDLRPALLKATAPPPEYQYVLPMPAHQSISRTQSVQPKEGEANQGKKA